jgi:hypothetical protein
MSGIYLVPGHISIPSGPLGVVLLILVVLAVGILAAVFVWEVVTRGLKAGYSPFNVQEP